MKLRSLACAAIGVGSITAAAAAGVDTTDPTVIAAFQSGLTVQTFESLAGRTPQAITAYTQGVPVSPNAFVFNQVPGVQFSVGGVVGTNMPALYQLGGAIAGNAHSGSTVLGPVDSTSPPSSAGRLHRGVLSGQGEQRGLVEPRARQCDADRRGHQFRVLGPPGDHARDVRRRHRGPLRRHLRPTADIGGFKIIGTGTTGLTVDDFSYGVAGVTTPIPEPAEWALLLGGAAAMAAWRRRGSQRNA